MHLAIALAVDYSEALTQPRSEPHLVRKVDLVADAVRPAATAAAAARRRLRLLDGRGGGRGRGLAHYGANRECRESAAKGACNSKDRPPIWSRKMSKPLTTSKHLEKVDTEKLFSPLNIHSVYSLQA